ncbi:MAG: hypothetical protein DCC55_02615 [Chloroflexi bacterium]|nr:MAG: hypothetical protein DCC55_02615 [Chloroflexota bacterium]
MLGNVTCELRTNTVRFEVDLTRRYASYRFWTLFIACLAGVIIDCTPVYASPIGQGSPTLQECSQVDEAALQDELNRVTQQVFAEALVQVDLAALVKAEWQETGMDAVIDSEIDRAVARVRNEQALWDTFLSGWSAEKAEELTRAVATYAFESEAFAQKIDELSAAVADELAQTIAVLSAESVSAAFYCLQTFIADNYAEVLVHKFEQQVQAAAQAVDVGNSNELDTSILTVLNQHRTALGGVGVIVAAQIARRVMANLGRQIARRVAGRIAGRVLGRIGTELIPIVGWVVGTGLIAYDLYSSRDGALPQIQEQLKSQEVKAGIRDEIVAAMEPEFRREAPQIARDVANELFSQWRDVRRNIRQVLALAESDAAFHALLNRLESTDDLAKLVSLVGVAVPALGEEGFQRAVADGSLERVLDQPASALRIVEGTGSIETALAWSALAGSLLDSVVEVELYKHISPEQLSRPTLERLLALGNQAAIQKLALLNLNEIDTLLAVSTSNLNTLATRLTPEELRVVAGYLPLLEQEQRNQFISRVASDPAILPLLGSEAIKQRIIVSNDVDATLAFLASPRSLDSLVADLSAVVRGQVGMGLFTYKYGAGQSALIGIGLIFLAAIVLRLVYTFVLWLVRPVSPLFRR